MARQDEDIGGRQQRGDVVAIAEQPQPLAQTGVRAAAPPCRRRDPRSSRSPTTHSSASGTVAHRGGQFRIALVPHQPGHRERPPPDPSGTPSAARMRARAAGSGRNTAGSRPLPTGDGAAEDAQPPRVRRLASLNGQEDVGDPAADPFHREADRRGAASEPGLLNRKPWHV